MSIDLWQVIGSITAASFTVGFIDQLRITLKTKNVDGLSLIQWFMFTVASAVFTAYYAHLTQWLMFAASIFGALCFLFIVGLIVRFRGVAS